MSTDLVITLLVPWLFWGVLAALLFYAGRSWINLLFITVVITLMLLMMRASAGPEETMWFSLLAHACLFVFFLGSYIAFVHREQKKKKK